MSEQVVEQKPELVPTEERIRSALLGIEIAAHRNINEHDATEHLQAEYLDEEGGYHSSELTHGPSWESTNPRRRLIVSDGEHRWAYSWLGDGRVIRQTQDANGLREGSGPVYADEMADHLETLLRDVRDDPWCCTLNGCPLGTHPAELSQPPAGRAPSGTFGVQPEVEMQVGRTAVEQAWSEVGMLVEFARQEWDTYDMNQAITLEGIDVDGVRQYRQLRWAVRQDQSGVWVYCPWLVKREGNYEENYLILDTGQAWWWASSEAERAAHGSEIARRYAKELQRFRGLAWWYPGNFRAERLAT